MSEKYKPSEEEVQKAENHMNDRQRQASKYRSSDGKSGKKESIYSHVWNKNKSPEDMEVTPEALRIHELIITVETALKKLNHFIEATGKVTEWPRGWDEDETPYPKESYLEDQKKIIKALEELESALHNIYPEEISEGIDKRVQG